MNIKELIEEVERLKEQYKVCFNSNELKIIRAEIQGIKQTVEAVVNSPNYFVVTKYNNGNEYYKDWQTLKKLLGLK